MADKRPNTESVVVVENVSKTFKLPHEKNTSLKGLLINFYKGRTTYERQKALEHVSFTVKKGEFFAIVGRNGSGKSTLLKLLAGIYAPSAGHIQVEGKLTPFIELGVGFNPDLTGRENVFLNGALLGFTHKEMLAMYDDIVDFAEIERFMDQKLKNYSSGMQVRLAFSIAIRAKGDILLLDEVLAVGDSAFQQKCYNYFEELKEQKKTVVFVSHDMDAIRRFCTRAIYIKNGTLIHEGTPSEVADIYLEENMESSRQNSAKLKGLDLAEEYSLSAKISYPEPGVAAVKFSYKSDDAEGTYIGLSVMKEGVAVAELNTFAAKPLTGSGRATYYLDTTIFNGGLYHIGAGLFSRKNGELLAIVTKKAEFIVKGSDATRGSALKLADTWKYE